MMEEKRVKAKSQARATTAATVPAFYWRIACLADNEEDCSLNLFVAVQKTFDLREAFILDLP